MDYNPDSAADRQQLAFALCDAIIAQGFEREANTVKKPSGQVVEGEMVYSQPVPGDLNLRVVVYTSIIKGQVRQVAKDAIRVAAVYVSPVDKKERGVVKATRVHRMGSVDAIVERCLERIEIVKGKCHNGIERCDQCGAPLFTSKNKNKVCADLCWLKDKDNTAAPETAASAKANGSTRGFCSHCGAPLFKSKKGNWVCADLCWKKNHHGRRRRR